MQMDSALAGADDDSVRSSRSRVQSSSIKNRYKKTNVAQKLVSRNSKREKEEQIGETEGTEAVAPSPSDSNAAILESVRTMAKEMAREMARAQALEDAKTIRGLADELKRFAKYESRTNGEVDRDGDIAVGMSGGDRSGGVSGGKGGGGGSSNNINEYDRTQNETLQFAELPGKDISISERSSELRSGEFDNSERSMVSRNLLCVETDSTSNGEREKVTDLQDRQQFYSSKIVAPASGSDTSAGSGPPGDSSSARKVAANVGSSRQSKAVRRDIVQGFTFLHLICGFCMGLLVMLSVGVFIVAYFVRKSRL